MKKTIKVEGMMCENCVRHVKEALEGFDKNVVVELSDKTAVLNTECSDDELIDAIEEAGYDVKEIISE